MNNGKARKPTAIVLAPGSQNAVIQLTAKCLDSGYANLWVLYEFLPIAAEFI